MMKRQPAAGMPQISEEAQKALDELRKTTTNHFRLGVSEDELSILLTESLNNAVKCQGKNVPAEMSGVIGSIANVIHGASNCTGVLLQGDFGTGKTTLIKSVIGVLRALLNPYRNSFTSLSPECCQVSMIDLFLHKGDNAFDDMVNVDYLLIDDVGWESNFGDIPRTKEI